MTPAELFDAVARRFQSRPCFICERYGWCGHREPEIERAYILASAPQPKGVQRELAAPAAIAHRYVNGGAV